jgi:hypothetical protein
MVRMGDPSATLPQTHLSGFGQLYVTTVGAVAVLSLLADSHAWYFVLVVLALPLSLVALWVGFYAALAVGLAVGADPAQFSWPVALVWVAVWTATAWINAQLSQKVLRNGWAAIAPRPRETDDDD